MRITERQLRSLIAQHVLRESMRSHTRSDIIRSVIRESLLELDEQEEDSGDDEEDFLTRSAKTIKRKASEYGETAAEMGLRGLAAIADTLVSPAHAPESAEQARADQAAWEKRRLERIRSVGDIASGVFMLKHRLGAKLADQLGQDELIRDIYGHELTDELLAGSMLHDVLMAFSFTPAAAVPAMVLDTIAYAAEDNKEAAILTLAMAGLAQAGASKLKSEIPKNAVKVKSGESLPITIDDIAGIEKYEDLADLASKKKPNVNVDYKIVCVTNEATSGGLRVCWKVPVKESEVAAAVAAVREIGDKIVVSGFPGAKGITESAITKLKSGEFNIGEIADSSRMSSAAQEVKDLTTQGSGGQNLLQRSRLIVDEAKRRSLAILQSRTAGNVRNTMDAEIGRQSSIHAETGTYEVPMLPDESAMSKRTAERSREKLEKQGVPRQKVASGDTDAVIVGLSRYGISLESTYMSSWGRKCLIVKAPNGERFAYYKSSGTGSGTPEGTFVPYKGISITLDPKQSYMHVSKTKFKVPFVGDPTESVARTVFDAINHPFVREPLDRAVFAGNLPKFSDPYDLNGLSIRQFLDDVGALATENVYLKSMGVELSAAGTYETAIFPWLDGAPIPPALNGRTLRVSEILDQVYATVKNSPRYPDGQYSLRQLYALDSSILNSPNGVAATLSSYSFDPTSPGPSGRIIKYTGPRK